MDQASGAVAPTAGSPHIQALSSADLSVTWNFQVGHHCFRADPCITVRAILGTPFCFTRGV